MNYNKTRLSYLEGWLSIIVNIILFIIKYWAGIITGSIALIADAWHTLSDSISSIIVVVSIKASVKPADNEHPFGHGRFELIASIVIGVILAIIAFDFAVEGINRLRNRISVDYGLIAIVVTIVSILAKEALAQFAIWAGNKANSTTLRADAWHHRSDALSSVVILIGIFLNRYFWWIDGVLAIIVALLIGYASYQIFKDSVNPLLGQEPDKILLKKINKICVECCGDGIEAHHFHIHDYVNHRELTFHIRLNRETTIANAHQYASQIESIIKKELNIEATIHMEPLKSEQKK